MLKVASTADGSRFHPPRATFLRQFLPDPAQDINCQKRADSQGQGPIVYPIASNAVSVIAEDPAVFPAEMKRKSMSNFSASFHITLNIESAPHGPASASFTAYARQPCINCAAGGIGATPAAAARAPASRQTNNSFRNHSFSAGSACGRGDEEPRDRGGWRRLSEVRQLEVAPHGYGASAPRGPHGPVIPMRSAAPQAPSSSRAYAHAQIRADLFTHETCDMMP
jgi:hypothetical protein